MQLRLPIHPHRAVLGAKAPAQEWRWRPVHYLGSKLRVLDSIIAALEEIEPNGLPVCDLFAGSGTVAAALASKRNVVAVDIQEYSRVLCSALLCPAKIDPDLLLTEAINAQNESARGGLVWASSPLIEHEFECLKKARAGSLNPLCDLIEYGSVAAYQAGTMSWGGGAPLKRAIEATIANLSLAGLLSSRRSMVLRHFGGVYFSYVQAVELDILLDIVEQRFTDARDTAVAAILSTASEIVNTVGKQFAQPIRPRDSSGKPKKTLFNLVSRDRFKETFAVFREFANMYATRPALGGSHHVVRDDYANFFVNSPHEIGVVYADPPYTRDHYSRFYHVLETLCLRDDPVISTRKVNGTTQLSRGIYRIGRYQSPFCIKSQAPQAFERLFTRVARRGLPLVLSYSPYASEKQAHPRVVTIDRISDLAKTYFGTVEIRSAGQIFHSRLNKVCLNKEISYEAETLFLCRP